jgi:hypothetical protein
MRFVLDHVRLRYFGVGSKERVSRLRTASWQPRCLRNASVRPVALRPRLSASLPRARGDAAESLPISQANRSPSTDSADGDSLQWRSPAELMLQPREKCGLS